MLTPTHQKILHYCEQYPDATFEEIAEAQGIKISTVKTHVQAIRNRLDLKKWDGLLAAVKQKGAL